MTTMTTDNATVHSTFLTHAREAGAAAFERSPMPTRKDESWRFT
jgi:hypothetical protein